MIFDVVLFQFANWLMNMTLILLCIIYHLKLAHFLLRLGFFLLEMNMHEAAVSWPRCIFDSIANGSPQRVFLEGEIINNGVLYDKFVCVLVRLLKIVFDVMASNIYRSFFFCQYFTMGDNWQPWTDCFVSSKLFPSTIEWVLVKCSVLCVNEYFILFFLLSSFILVAVVKNRRIISSCEHVGIFISLLG